ncbi:MAG: RES family NAD+ phosphorylase [Proteobacteria bacterium]|nr:RES family NAD+ phosphorylase [Pseudomonadota bacterium]
MKVYRFVSLRFPDALSCEGARRYGGRWNSKGIAVLYCALNESLAMLELRVHSPHPYPRTRWKFAIDVPDDALTEAPVEQLPRGWDALPAGPASKRYGDHWLQQRSSLGLLVPSVVASEEKNLILNPSHPRFQEIQVISKQRVMLDKRLYSLTRATRTASYRKAKK